MKRSLMLAERDDAGTTMLEMLVAMTLMTVFMTMFTTAVVMMTSSTNKTDAAVNTAGQVNNAYLRLDKLVRYASAISTPGKGSTTGDWYVEFSVPTTANKSTCNQLRVDISSSQLQLRSWSVNADQSAGTATSWVPLANSVTNGSAAASSPTTPFTLTTPASSLYRQLQITLVSSQVSPATSTATSTVTFTALNSTQTSSTSVCQQVTRS
jgi:type II secretory pathway component PulJ